MQLLRRLLLTVAGALLASSVDASSLGLSADDREQQLDPGERDRAVASLESNLLSLLGMTRRPRPRRGQTHVPEPLRQLYRRQGAAGVVDVAKRGINVGNANTVRSFVHVESEIDDLFKSAHNFRLSFDVSSVPESERLHAAELILNRKSLRPALRPDQEENEVATRQVKLMVHDIVRPGVKGKSKPLLRLVDSKLLDIRSNASVSLDVRPAVERWMSGIPGQSENHGLLVKVIGKASPQQRGAHVRLRRSPGEDLESWQLDQPTLYTYTNDGRTKTSSASEMIERRMKRRALRKNRRKDRQDNCRRHPFYVDFAEIGWDEWIVAPSGYDAYYCHGECPYPLADHLNATKHAVVQNIVHSMDPSQAPATCCVPTSLGAISILYLNDNNQVVLKNYKDMSVLECGCR